MGKKTKIVKTVLKATPPGMMITAGKKAIEEFKRLTKPKKRPEAKTGPVKRSVKQKKEMEAKKNLERLRTIRRTVKKRRPKYGIDLTTKQKEKILKQPRKAPPKVVRDRRDKRKK